MGVTKSQYLHRNPLLNRLDYGGIVFKYFLNSLVKLPFWKPLMVEECFPGLLICLPLLIQFAFRIILQIQIGHIAPKLLITTVLKPYKISLNIKFHSGFIRVYLAFGRANLGKVIRFRTITPGLFSWGSLMKVIIIIMK